MKLLRLRYKNVIQFISTNILPYLTDNLLLFISNQETNMVVEHCVLLLPKFSVQLSFMIFCTKRNCLVTF